MGKKTYVYTMKFQRVEEELTFEKFVDGLYNAQEYFFRYGDMSIDVAFHFSKGNKIYELNINGYQDDAKRYEFSSVEELLSAKVVDGKSIKDIWDELEN